MPHDQLIRFGIGGMYVREFAILSPNIPIGENIQTTFSFSFSFLAGQAVIATVIINYHSNEVNHLKLTFDCVFSIEKDDWHFIDKYDSFVLPKPLAIHLMMLTYGSARGVLFSRTEGTPWHLSILPLVDLTLLVKEDIVTPKPTNTLKPTPQT